MLNKDCAIENETLTLQSPFQGVLPIYKYPKVIQGPNINEMGPNDGDFQPEKYFECPVLDHKVEKIDLSFKWKDQVIYRNMDDFASLSLNWEPTLSQLNHILTPFPRPLPNLLI